jgi:hypothetical protein
MSELQDVCATLEAIDDDILQMAHELHGKAQAYSQAAQRAAAAGRGADGEGSAALARTAAALATASRNCAQAASALTGASREGQAYVKRTVGARSGSGGAAGSMAAAAPAPPDGAAMDAWDQALPAQRGAWEMLQDKYPERTGLTPGTQPDGSWVGGNDSRLTPGQNAEVDHGIARVREAGEKAIIPGVRAVEVEDGSRRLAGFEYRFKGADRLKEKVAKGMLYKSRSATAALALVPDPVRFTFQYGQTAYTAGVRKDIERLKARGFSLLRLGNTWASDQYKGINSRWRDPGSGVRFEVQFHTGASFEAKQLTHKSYERLRSIAQDSEKKELMEFQHSVTSMIPIPPGVSGIEDYPPRGQ